MDQVTLIFGAPSDLTVLFGFSSVNLVMALIDALRIVISENHGKGMEKLKEAILSWARKKKISSEEFKKLRTLYINDHWPSPADARSRPGGDSPLSKGASIAEIATSLARLALDELENDYEESEGELGGNTITKKWLQHELRKVQETQKNALTSSLEKIQMAFNARLDEFFQRVCVRIEKAEHAIEALKLDAECEIQALKNQNSEQADKILELETKMAAIADVRENEERQKRAVNVIVEGLPIESKSQQDTFDCVVNDLLVSKLEVPCRPISVVRLLTPAPGTGKLKLRVQFRDVAEKISVLKSCKKLKKIPEIRVWEDLTPKQQENRKAKIPKLRSLRQEGKIAFFRADRLFVKDSPEAVPVLFQ